MVNEASKAIAANEAHKADENVEANEIDETNEADKVSQSCEARVTDTSEANKAIVFVELLLLLPFSLTNMPQSFRK